MKSLHSYMTNVNESRSNNKEQKTAKIQYNGQNIDVECLSDGDIILEARKGEHWIVSTYTYKDKLWYVQENLDETKVGEGEDSIIDIAKVNNFAAALYEMDTYLAKVK